MSTFQTQVLFQFVKLIPNTNWSSQKQQQRTHTPHTEVLSSKNHVESLWSRSVRQEIWCPDGEGERHHSVVPKEAVPQNRIVGVNLLSAIVPVDQQKCLRGHVCLLLQVATGDGQLAVPMERRCGLNKRRREKENQLNLRWPLETTWEEPSQHNL